MTAASEPSTLSFVGTVGSVTDAPDSGAGRQRQVRVRVDEVVGTPSALGDLTGATVVVLLPEHISVASGQRRLFHTVGVSYGATITLRAVDVAPAADAPTGAGLSGVDHRLVSAVGRADAIVVGLVIELGEPGPNARLTEHDPRPALARIRVDETLLGSSPSVAEVSVPTSSDVMWSAAPRLRVGDEAVFVLASTAASAGAAPEVIAVYATDAVDDVKSAIRQQ